MLVCYFSRQQRLVVASLPAHIVYVGWAVRSASDYPYVFEFVAIGQMHTPSAKYLVDCRRDTSFLGILQARRLAMQEASSLKGSRQVSATTWPVSAG